MPERFGPCVRWVLQAASPPAVARAGEAPMAEPCGLRRRLRSRCLRKRARSWRARNGIGRAKRRNCRCTVCQGGKSFGSIRQPPPVRAMQRIAFNASRRYATGLRPRFAGGGNNGAVGAHSSSVRPGGQRSVLRPIAAMRPRVSGVRIDSADREPRSSATSFSNGLSPQTGRTAAPPARLAALLSLSGDRSRPPRCRSPVRPAHAPRGGSNAPPGTPG